MLLATLSVLVLAQPQAELKVAAPGLTTTGLDPKTAGPLTNHLARAFTGVRVITPDDISALLGLDRQKQLVGCSDDGSNCMAELGDALGVQGVLLGDVVKLGGAVQINARILDPVEGRTLAAASARAENEAGIFDALTKVGQDLNAQLLAKLGRAPAPVAVVPVTPVNPDEPPMLPPDEPVPVTTASSGTRRFFPLPLAIAAASLAASIGLFIVSENEWRRLTEGPVQSLTITDAGRVVANGKLCQTLGVTFAIVAGVAAATSVGLLLYGSRSSVALSLTPNGVAVAGAW